MRESAVEGDAMSSLGQPEMSDKEMLVEVKGLRKLFAVRAGMFRKSKHFVHAVDGVDFAIAKGEVLGLVGESGCGKTTVGRLMVRTILPSGGTIQFDGMEVASLKGKDLSRFRQSIQMIFQDPYESLNPRMTVYDIVSESLAIHRIGTLRDREQRTAHMLEQVGLKPAGTFMFRYPHELSGGQRQRVAIARSLVLSPSFIVADEPTSMLDVSIRTEIMGLMMELQSRMGMSYLYITHDLGVARYQCDRIGVMYLGRMVEMGGSEDVTQDPLHPYTQALISAVPVPDPTFTREALEIKGGVSQPIDPADRCRFFDRCPRADEACETLPTPELIEVKENHYIACHHLKGEGF